MKKNSTAAGDTAGDGAIKSQAEQVMHRVAQRFSRDGLTTQTLQSKGYDVAAFSQRARPVPSCPKAMLERIDVARRSIAEAKERARKQGREYLPVFALFGFTEVAVAIFERLAYDANMEDAWRALAKIFDDTQPPTKRQRDTWAFADFCYQTIGVWEFSPRRSPAEHKRYFEQIADDVLSVAARVVCEPEFGMIGTMAANVSSLEMVGDDHLKGLLEEMDADPIDGRYIKSEKEAIDYLRFCLGDIIPDLYHYAEWIAENARRIAAQPSISDRPHRDTAQRTFFVRHLSKWFRERFDQPMHEVVAGVASALFDEAVTADTVRKAVESMPEVSSPFRRGKLPLPE